LFALIKSSTASHTMTRDAATHSCMARVIATHRHMTRDNVMH